jgi:hypothetical protein
MPQINPQQGQKQSATTIKENKPFRERLRDRYAPTDYVRVINIDNESFEWQYFPTTGEETYFTDNGAVRVTEGRQRFTSNFDGKIPGNEQFWTIGAGESEILLGENADLMIEGLYKKVVAKKRISDSPGREATQAISFNWNDGLLQEQTIDKIYLGIEKPTFNEPKVNEPTTSGPTAKK